MARRAYGQGAIYRRADGRWEAQLRLGSGERKSFYGRSRREAAEKLAEASWMIASQLPVRCRTMTVETYLMDWLDVVRRRVRPSTITNYELNVRRLCARLGDLPLTRLSPPTIQEIYRVLADDGLSPYSVLQAHRTLKQALGQAHAWGLIARNPATALSPPKPQARPATALSIDELRCLIRQTRDERFHALWLVMATGGLRFGEALGLTWDNVDLETGQVRVRQALQRQQRNGFVFTPLKTRASRRTVSLIDLTNDALRKQRRRCDGLPVRDAWAGLVFKTSAGGPLDQAQPTHALKRALRRAGLPNIRTHDLRHTAATALLVAGVHPKVVQEFLGHSSIKVTMDIYSHLMPTMHTDAMKLLERLLQGPNLGRLDREQPPSTR